MTISRRKFMGVSMGASAVLASPAFFHMAKAEDGFLEITTGPTKQKLYLPGAPASDLWTYNGSAPGPEIRVKQGERVKVRLTNNLEEPTSIHWHGIRIDNAMDGVSGLTQEAVPTGGTFEYDFIAPDAGTYWYHAHNKSWNQVARGLYGALIVEEDEPAFDAAHDLTLVMDDWRLNQQGVLDIASIGSIVDWSHGGRLGNWLMANGQNRLKIEVNAGEAYRLRLINACNSRVLEIDPEQFNAKVMAFDGQSLGEAVSLGYSPMLIGPAQRVDLLVVPQAGQDFAIEEVSGKQPYSFIQFKVAGNAQKLAIPAIPVANKLPQPDIDAPTKVRLHMSGGAMGRGGDIIYKGRKLTREEFRSTGQVWSFNGVANIADDPFFRVERGQSVELETFNDTAFLHAMHVHGHHFRITERGGSTIDEGQPWRDTFLVGPGQTTKIAFVADNPGKWLFHCHMLEHAAAGMNTWFEVV